MMYDNMVITGNIQLINMICPHVIRNNNSNMM